MMPAIDSIEVAAMAMPYRPASAYAAQIAAHTDSDVLAEAREITLQRLVEHAQSLGADAVVGLRFDSNTMGESSGLLEILALGTAVKLAG